MEETGGVRDGAVGGGGGGRRRPVFVPEKKKCFGQHLFIWQEGVTLFMARVGVN